MAGQKNFLTSILKPVDIQRNQAYPESINNQYEVEKRPKAKKPKNQSRSLAQKVQKYQGGEGEENQPSRGKEGRRKTSTVGIKHLGRGKTSKKGMKKGD